MPSPSPRVIALTRQIQPVLQEGDLIFIAVNSVLYRKVAESSGGWTSHVGIVVRDDHGEWQVYESAVFKSRLTPLAVFVGRTYDGKVAVCRLQRGVQPAELERIKQAAKQRMGIWYDFGFDFHGKGLFCSKFVYEIYKAATGVAPGRLESFRQMRATRPEVSLRFWYWWFFGFIPWDRVTVSPHSQYCDPRFEIVLETG